MPDYAQPDATSSYAYTLRPYQQDGVGAIREAFGLSKRVLYVLPTGGGKTVMFSYITYYGGQKGNRIYITAHRQEICDQISEALVNMGVPHGMIGPHQPITGDQVQVAMVQTLARRLKKLPPPQLLVVDEAHHAVAGTWRKLLDFWPECYVLGVTATPERLDGKGLGEAGFERLVLGPDTAELIEMGFLAPFQYLSAGVGLSLDGIKTVAGDYDMHEVESRMSSKKIVGDIIEHYRKHLDGKTCIAFCVTVKHAQDIADAYNAAGIAAASIDGSMTRAERATVVNNLREGRIKVLTSCEIISEGFDAPSVGGCQLLRPTKSFGLHRQQVGRCLRPKLDGSGAVILDHVMNYRRHGRPDEPHAWTLETKQKPGGTHEAPTRTCAACGGVFSIGFTKDEACTDEPDCIFKRQLPQQRDGELVDIQWRAPVGDVTWAGGLQFARFNYVKLIKRAEGKRERLEQIADSFGYKKGWIWHQQQEYENKTGIWAPWGEW